MMFWPVSGSGNVVDVCMREVRQKETDICDVLVVSYGRVRVRQ